MDLESPAARSLITLVLCGALLLTAGASYSAARSYDSIAADFGHGSYFALRIRERAMQLLLATTPIIVAGKLAYDHVESSMTVVTAFSATAAR